MKKILVYFLLVFSISIADSKTMINKECEDAWQSITNTKFSLAWLSNWDLFYPKCNSDGIYYYRKSLILNKLKKVKDSIRNLTSVEGKKISNQRFITLGLSEAYFQSWIKFNDQDDFEKFKSYATSLVNRYPEWSQSYEELGLFYFVTEDYKESVNYFKKGINIGAVSGGTYRNLVLALYKLDRHKQVLKWGQIASQNFSFLHSDKDFMISLSTSFAEEGHFRTSENILLKLAELKPEIENDMDYRRTVNYVLSLRDKN